MGCSPEQTRRKGRVCVTCLGVWYVRMPALSESRRLVEALGAGR